MLLVLTKLLGRLHSESHICFILNHTIVNNSAEIKGSYPGRTIPFESCERRFKICKWGHWGNFFYYLHGTSFPSDIHHKNPSFYKMGT